MSLLELGGRKFTIPVGEVALGSDTACAILLAGADVLPRHALFQGQPDGQVVIRKAAPAAEVLINGVRLGAEPTPLLHGDKVEVGGHELTFVDERRSGSTQFIEKLQMPEASGQPPAARGTGKPGVATNTGGRYYPDLNGWVSTSTGSNVPAARYYHTAVWTGTEMIVWGGRAHFPFIWGTGGRYDPVTGTWR